jgi:hypothetical protein
MNSHKKSLNGVKIRLVIINIFQLIELLDKQVTFSPIMKIYPNKTQINQKIKIQFKILIISLFYK